MRKYSGTIKVDVDVEVSEILDEMDDEQIVEEAKLRGLTILDRGSREAWTDLADEIRRASRNDPFYLDVLLDRMLGLADVPRVRIPAGHQKVDIPELAL